MEALSRYKMITTNTGAKTPREAIKLAQVILLGEFHWSGSETLNTALINRSFREGDLNLVEGSIGDRPFSDQCKLASRSWDVSFRGLGKIMGQLYLLGDGVSALPGFYRSRLYGEKGLPSLFEDMNVCSLCRFKDGKYEPFALDERPLTSELVIQKIAGLKKGSQPITLQGVDRMLPVWLEAIKGLHKQFWSLLQSHAVRRAQSIVKHILSYKGKGKIFVTAGTAHLRYIDPKFFPSIDMLYRRLNESGIRYVTLQPRKLGSLQPTKREMAGTLHSKEAGNQKNLAYWKKQNQFIQACLTFPSVGSKEWLTKLENAARRLILRTSGAGDYYAMYFSQELVQQLQKARPLQSKL